MTTPSPSARLATLDPVARGDFVEYIAVQRSGDVQFAHACVEAGGGALTLALGYRRCLDFDETDGAGQDSVVLRISPDFVVGVIADGVSQSFYGDLAADGLATAVADALWAGRHRPFDAATFDGAMMVAADALRSRVASVALSPGLPPLQRAALERTRAHGSQAVFSAVRFHPATGKCDLLQVGDVPAVVEADGAIERIDAPPDGRWSSEPRPTIGLQHRGLAHVTRILLKTDGAGPEWGESLDPGVLGSADAFRRLSDVQAPVDDVSFLSLAFSRTRTRATVDIRKLLAAASKPAAGRPSGQKRPTPAPGPPGLAPPLVQQVPTARPRSLFRTLLTVGSVLWLAAVGAASALAVYAVVAVAGFFASGPDIRHSFDCGLASATLDAGAIVKVRPRVKGLDAVEITMRPTGGRYATRDRPRIVVGPVPWRGEHTFVLPEETANDENKVAFEVSVTDPDGDVVFARRFEARRGQTCTLTLGGRL